MNYEEIENLNHKVKEAITIIRKYAPKNEIYYLAYSGGKDSDVLLHIARKSGVNFQAIHNFTTLEHREQIKHVRKQQNVKIIYPEKTFYQLVEEKGLPTRFRRWCCASLKHNFGKGKITITGVRKSESIKRQKTVKEFKDFNKIRQVNPLLNWTTEDIWNYIKKEKIETCKLYKMGYNRVGCIGCPLANTKQRKKQYQENKNIKKAVIKSFSVYIDKTDKVKKVFGTAENGVEWWISGLSIKQWKFNKTKNKLNFKEMK